MGLTVQRLNRSHGLCSDHFEDHQFMNYLKNRLVHDAVPTLFKVRIFMLLKAVVMSMCCHAAPRYHLLKTFGDIF